MPIVPIVVLVLLLAGFVFVYLSRETWRWYTITLTILIMISSVVWFYLAARALQTEAAWNKEIAQYQKTIVNIEKERDEALYGDPGAEPPANMTIAEQKVAVQKALQGRGRRWDRVERRAVAENGAITAFIEQPEQHGIEANSVLFVFDDLPATDGGQFLGEFEVSAVNGQEVQLSPVSVLRPTQIERIMKNRREPLILYEIMPADSHEFFAELKEADRVSAFPDTVSEATKQEYLKDGKPPEAGEMREDRIWIRVKALKDFTITKGEGETQEQHEIKADTELVLDPKSAQERIAAGDVEAVPDGKVYVRELRDYVSLYRDINASIADRQRSINEVASQLAAVQESQRKLDADIAARAQEIEALKRDLDRFNIERQIIVKHVAAVEQEIQRTHAELRRLYLENKKKEAELTALIRQAADEINRRIPVNSTQP
jgi:hypothetical protein